MFRQACALAKEFTWPVVLSRKTVGGKCSSSIGALVVINRDGWFVTAEHIIDQYMRLLEDSERVKNIIQSRQQIENDRSISRNERRRRVSQLSKIKNDNTEKCSGWWGRYGVDVKEVQRLKVVDLAIGRFDPFDPDSVTNYPIFKDPSRGFDVGASLCRMGFPFHAIEPVYVAENDAFELPPGSVPLPLFPIEGIFTRHVDIAIPPGADQLPFPYRYLETSSPGLRGQSGGPIFDIRGSVWAIQSQTMHFPLGFEPSVRKGQVDHQFLNVGMGIHAETLIGAFRDLQVEFRISDY